jgi:hypothetical protein
LDGKVHQALCGCGRPDFRRGILDLQRAINGSDHAGGVDFLYAGAVSKRGTACFFALFAGAGGMALVKAENVGGNFTVIRKDFWAKGKKA